LLILINMSKASSKELLRKKIIASLRKQGFVFRRGRIELPPDLDKDDLRRIHLSAVEKRRAKSQPYLERFEDDFIVSIANGGEVEPGKIAPKLIKVLPDSFEELLFRWISLHWSIPVSSGYGRRLRFLVKDISNGKIIGLFGLGDPVFGLAPRDKWIGWDYEMKRRNLYHVMDAYVLGAVPPYSLLLCGKLIALLVISNPVREAFRKKYSKQESTILGKVRPPYLTLVTTTSAFGRSSIYNRLSLGGGKWWYSLGYTSGSGDFHFSDGLYDAMRAFALENCIPTAKQEAWGSGFRNKREVIRKCLAGVGLPPDIIYHGIAREVFAAPLGKKTLRYLRGEVSYPKMYDRTVHDITQAFKERWMLPRARWDNRYYGFAREEYYIWK
jgi:hypothetical protein